MSDRIVDVTDETFEAEVLNADKAVLVDYWAEWCSPCKAITPILEEIADEYDDRLKIVKLNIDQSQKNPTRYGIRGIPTLILFRNGNEEGRKTGAVNKSALTAFIDSNL